MVSPPGLVHHRAGARGNDRRAEGSPAARGPEHRAAPGDDRDEPFGAAGGGGPVRFPDRRECYPRAWVDLRGLLPGEADLRYLGVGKHNPRDGNGVEPGQCRHPGAQRIAGCDASKPPRWMARLEEADPKFAFFLGLALLGVFPSDIMTSIAAGLHLGHRGAPWWQCLPFVALTLLLPALPAIAVAAAGKRAHTVLPRISTWMNPHAWIVNEVVLAFFTAITINALVGAG